MSDVFATFAQLLLPPGPAERLALPPAPCEEQTFAQPAALVEDAVPALQAQIEVIAPEQMANEIVAMLPVQEEVAAAAPIEPAQVPTPDEIVVALPEVEEHVSAEAAVEKLPGRPFRVKLRGSVLVLVTLPNKRSLRAALHQLSTTGGVIHFEKPLDEKLVVEMVFCLQKTTIRSRAQLLFPMWATQGWMQPFRFVDMPETNRTTLDAALKTFMSGGAKGAAAGR